MQKSKKKKKKDFFPRESNRIGQLPMTVRDFKSATIHLCKVNDSAERTSHVPALSMVRLWKCAHLA